MNQNTSGFSYVKRGSAGAYSPISDKTIADINVGMLVKVAVEFILDERGPTMRETIWLRVTEIQGTQIVGRLESKPLLAKDRFVMGGKFSVEPEFILDIVGLGF